MKKLIILLALIFMVPAPAQANGVITLTEPSHRQIDGKFFDDSLTNLLMPTGRLGKLIYNVPPGYRTWNIDAALVEEVQAMANGYKLIDGKDGLGQVIAKQWIQSLTAISKFDQIYALPYGNPSGYWIHRLSPHSESYFLTVGAAHLSKFYGHEIAPLKSYIDFKYFHLTSYQSQAFIDANSAIQVTSKYMDPIQSETFHLRSAVLFNQGLDNHWRNLLAKDLVANTQNLSQKIRLAPGKFTISANKQDLPITVINDFPSPANLILNISEINGRIQAINKIQVKLDGKSRVQVKIPVEVLTSGDSAIAVGIANDQGINIGDYVDYPISIRVISPIATWITYIAAVILFVSAVIQSVRRLRRRER